MVQLDVLQIRRRSARACFELSVRHACVREIAFTSEE